MSVATSRWARFPASNMLSSTRRLAQSLPVRLSHRTGSLQWQTVFQSLAHVRCIRPYTCSSPRNETGTNVQPILAHGSEDRPSNTTRAKTKATTVTNHHAIATVQSLYITNPVSPGTPFFLPHGTRIFIKLQQFLRAQYVQYGFDEVISPTVYKRSLWEQSGHWENFKDDMFEVTGRGAKGQEAAAGQLLEIGEEEEYGLKPMNCPGHCIMFKHKIWSWRELPVRYADFSPLHRNEISSALTGLTRVRRFHQDDGHIFCRPSQVSEEISKSLEMLALVYLKLRIPSYRLVLSTRPKSHIGELAEWDRAERDLRSALDSSGKEWALNEGDGAFYGPKIDILVKDVNGKEHQTATIQLDFQLPRRFDLKYKGEAPVKNDPAEDHAEEVTEQELVISIDGDNDTVPRETEEALEETKAESGTLETETQEQPSTSLDSKEGRLKFIPRPTLKKTEIRAAKRAANEDTDSSQLLNTPVMIHRALLGSVERFMAILIDQHNGEWPFWLSPRQCIIIPLKPREQEYIDAAKKLKSFISGAPATNVDDTCRSLRAPDFHVDIDLKQDAFGKRRKSAQDLGYNFIVILGEKELNSGIVTVKKRSGDEMKMGPHDILNMFEQLEEQFQ